MQFPTLLLTPEVSQDGRWLAYQSNEGGGPQIYVRPYPNIDGGKVQVSTTGGSRPAWSRDGRELFFLDAEGRLSVVPYSVAGERFVPGPARRVLENAYYPGFTRAGSRCAGTTVRQTGSGS